MVFAERGSMEGMITRKVELKGIGALSLFKIYFTMTLIFSLVSFIVFNLFGSQLINFFFNVRIDFQQFLNNLRVQFPDLFKNEILMSLTASVINGFIVGLFAAIGAAIFSFFAMILGGVKIKIREKNLEKKTTYL